MTGLPIISFAQKSRLVQGKITDSTHTPLPGVTVLLVIPETGDSIRTVSGKRGLFSFSGITASRFILHTSYSEYASFRQEYSIPPSETSFQVGEIILRPDIKLLKEILLGTPFILIREDTIEYKADSILLKPDASVEDLLKNLPGIEVSKNGVITAQGRPVYKVKVNGKDFFGTDVKMATRELPANIVDKIQVMDDADDPVAAGGIKPDNPAKVINLKLKKEKRNGVFGNLSAGYGTEESYQVKANTNFFSDRSQLSFYGNSNNINNGFVITGIGSSGMGPMSMSSGMISPGSNGRKRNILNIPEGITTTHSAGTNFRFDFGKNNSFYGSYSYRSSVTEGYREIYQQHFYPSGYFINNQRLDYSNPVHNHQAYLNLELNPDSLTYIKISPEFGLNESRSRNSTNFNYYRDTSIKTSEGYIKDTSKTRSPGFGVTVFYSQGFRKPGRSLTMGFSLNTDRSTLESFRPGFTRVYDALGGYSDSLQEQQILQNTKGNNYSLYITYAEPIRKNHFMELNLSHGYSRSSNNRDVYQPYPGPGNWLLIDALSDRYANRYDNDRADLTFRTVRKKYNYSLGMGLLPIRTRTFSEEKDSAYNRQTIINLAPSARFSYSFSRTRNLSVSYNGFSRRPGIIQLQLTRDISNPQFQTEGNPDLRPEFTHSLNLHYNSFDLLSGNSLFASLGFNATKNKIINSTRLLDTSGAQLSRPENINGMYSVSGFYNYSKPWQQGKYLLRVNGNFFYNRDANLVNAVRSTGNNWLLSQGAAFVYNNKSWLELGIEAGFAVSASRNLVNRGNASTYSSWNFGNTVSVDLPGRFVIRYDFEMILNRGLEGSFDDNIYLLNITAEKKLLKRESLYISFSGNNIFNQNASFAREITGNSINDSRSLQLARYYLFTLSYKWNRFGTGK